MPDLHNIRLPAGWYPDPDGADHRRWWDGTTWTQHTAPFQRPVHVYDVVDLIEPKKAAKGADEVGAPTPAPRRIRTAARLGRTLAALAHRMPRRSAAEPEPTPPEQGPSSQATAPVQPSEAEPSQRRKRRHAR